SSPSASTARNATATATARPMRSSHDGPAVSASGASALEGRTSSPAAGGGVSAGSVWSGSSGTLEGLADVEVEGEPLRPARADCVDVGRARFEVLDVRRAEDLAGVAEVEERRGQLDADGEGEVTDGREVLDARAGADAEGRGVLAEALDERGEVGEVVHGVAVERVEPLGRAEHAARVHERARPPLRPERERQVQLKRARHLRLRPDGPVAHAVLDGVVAADGVVLLGEGGEAGVGDGGEVDELGAEEVAVPAAHVVGAAGEVEHVAE